MLENSEPMVGFCHWLNWPASEWEKWDERGFVLFSKGGTFITLGMLEGQNLPDMYVPFSLQTDRTRSLVTHVTVD